MISIDKNTFRYLCYISRLLSIVFVCCVKNLNRPCPKNIPLFFSILRVCSLLSVWFSSRLVVYCRLFVIRECSLRLLDPNEYIFDVAHEMKTNTVQLLIKRMLWLTSFSHDVSCRTIDLYIDSLFYRLQADFLQGTMLIMSQDYLSDRFIVRCQHRQTNRSIDCRSSMRLPI
jgi:hypothetical protein